MYFVDCVYALWKEHTCIVLACISLLLPLEITNKVRRRLRLVTPWLSDPDPYPNPKLNPNFYPYPYHYPHPVHSLTTYNSPEQLTTSSTSL